MIITSTRVLAVFTLLALSLSSCASDKESDAVKAINSANAGASSAAAAASSAMAQLESAGLPAMSAAADTLASLKAAAEQALAAQSSAAGAAAVQSKSSVPEAGTTEPPKAATATAGSPCELLTEAEVSAALGAKVTALPTEQGEPLGGKQCTWTSATLPIRNYSIALTRTDGMMKSLVDAGQSAKSLYTDTKKMFNASEPVPGIGDEAVIVLGTILALKGDVFIYASTIFATSGQGKEALKSLTATAVGKL